MKNRIILVVIFSISLVANAQKATTSKDSITTFYYKFLYMLEHEYLDKQNINWKTIEKETKQNLLQYADFESSLKETEVVFNKIGATHSKVLYKNKEYSTKHRAEPEDFSEQWKTKFASKPSFEIKVLDNKFGYILMPAMSPEDNSPEKIHKMAQPMYDKITAVKSQNKIEGWIIDLRFNTGGDIHPMLLALYDFLGDNNVWGTLDSNKKPDQKIKLSQGKYYSSKKVLSYINPKGELLDKAKVALITGLLTASSGELTAISFKGRENTILIGEKTFGMTTANVSLPFPFSTTFVLSTAYDCDRNGNYYEHIIPDILISKQDNFDNLLADKNIQEAVKFIAGE